MGRERVGPDIFQSGPIIRCGARAALCVLLNTGNDGMFAGLSGETAPFDPGNEKDRLNSRR